MCEYWLHTQSVIALKSSHIHATGREESLYEKVNRVNHAAACFLFFVTIQRQSLWKRPFNPEVLSSHSQAMLFYV